MDPNTLPCSKTGNCVCNERLNGKTAVITGGNAGIGFETAKVLASKGCKLILACRNEERAKAAVERLKEEFPEADVDYVLLDLGSLDSVRECAKHIYGTNDKIDILINNAGIATIPQLTKDGFDIHFQTNHLGHFLLTNLLLDKIKQSEQGRIINLSSVAHRMGSLIPDPKKVVDSTYFGYANSKLCNILFTKGLSEKLKDTRVTCNSVHPGNVRTNFSETLRNSDFFWKIVYSVLRPFRGLISRTVEHGAQTSIHLSISDSVRNISGEYFVDCRVAESSEASRSSENIKKLWEMSEKCIEATKIISEKFD